jgi:TRAP-type uncharacterized transport system substrate-binding protein
MPLNLRAVLALLTILVPVTQAGAESLSERRAAKEAVETVEIEIACGKLDKENCAAVAPEINAKSVLRGVRLKPLESKGSVESVNGLCDGDVNLAIVQEDVLAARVGKPDCAGKVAVLGAPLYPYEGFMVVRADTPDDKFADMVNHVKQGGVLHIATGGAGSGGELTFRNILATAPEWKQIIDILPDGSSTALNKLRDRELDGFFVMDGPQSPLLQEVRETIDPKTKRQAFKFIDMRPEGKLLEAHVSGRRLYATAVIEARWFSAIKTIATPAIIAIREDYYRKQPDIAAKIRQSAEDALPVIAVRSGARPDWKQDFEHP